MSLNPLERVKETIDEIVNLIVIEIQKNQVNTSSFYVFLMEVLSKSMTITEDFTKDKEGHVKKYIVVSVGRVLVETYYPEYLEFYNEQVDTLVEIIINSYYLLKDSKEKQTFKKCFFCFFG